MFRDTHFLGSVVAVIALCGSASGGILFSYEDPDALVQEFLHFQPTSFGELGRLDYDSGITIRLTIDASEEQAGARTTVDATLTFINMTLGPVTQIGSSFIAQAAGRFEFRLVGAQTQGVPVSDLIFSGDFNDAALFTLFGSGSLNAAKNVDGGSLVLSAGPSLFTILTNDTGYQLPAGGFDPNGQSSAAWSLAQISDPINSQTLVSFPGSPDQFLPSFNAEAAFVARAEVVPAPGVLGLLVVGGTPVAFRRRRRR